MKLFRLAAVLLMAIAAAAQTTTVTGTIKDLTNSLVTSGYLQFTLTPQLGQTLSGSAFFTPQQVSCDINASGQVKANDGVSACVVASNTSFPLPGSYYQLQFCPYNACTAAINWFAYQTTQDVSSILPTPATLPPPLIAAVGGTGVTQARGTGPYVQLGAGNFVGTDSVIFDSGGNAVDSGEVGVGAPLITIYRSGSGTYTPPASSHLLHVRLCGGGGGGSGAGSAGSVSGTGGADTSFGTSLLRGYGGSGSSAYNPGAGGTVSCGSVSTCYGYQGQGSDAAVYGGSGITFAAGTRGASSPLGSGGLTSINALGNNATGACSGGGGGSMNNNVGSGGAGGSAGGFVEAWIFSPAASYAYVVGLAGSAGGAGTNGFGGGAGAPGEIIVEAW